ncbi:MAG: helix-hairpin-helix domain-containing protein [Halobacteria archaeon]
MAELTDIRGIGNSIESKLEEADIRSVNELANAEVDDLTEVGIGKKTGEKVLRRAKQKGVVIKSGGDKSQEQSNIDHVSTGVKPLDDMTGGGFEPGFLIGISGEHKAGKTQTIFQALASAVEDTGDPAIYIETEPNRFQAERVRDMCPDEEVFDNILVIEAYDLDQQKIAYQAVKDSFDSVSLVAVDSFVANFRLSDKFEGRSDFKERSNVLSRHLRDLQDLSTDMDCPVLMSLQVYGNPTAYDSSVPIWGGALMHHTITYLVHMSHSKGQLREAQVRGHPGKGDGEVTVKITDNGVEGIE